MFCCFVRTTSGDFFSKQTGRPAGWGVFRVCRPIVGLCFSLLISRVACVCPALISREKEVWHTACPLLLSFFFVADYCRVPKRRWRGKHDCFSKVFTKQTCCPLVVVNPVVLLFAPPVLILT